MTSSYDQIISKCQSALRVNYDRELRPQAESCFDAERALIEERGFTNVLVEAAEFGIGQQQHGRACRLYGAGCGSMINYLLDFSEVDPIRYRTLFQRFWITSDGSPPTFNFCVTSPTEGTKWTTVLYTEAVEPFVMASPVEGWEQGFALPDSSRSLVRKSSGGFAYFGEHVAVSPMGPLEQIPVLVERKFPQINIPMNDSATFEAITAGDTDGVDGFESEYDRNLAARVRPRRIDDLAVIMTLHQIAAGHPEFVDDYLTRLDESSNRDCQQRNQGSGAKLSLDFEAALFQESLLSILHHQFGLTWAKCWRFILDARKHPESENRLNENHPLWKEAIRNATHKCQDEIEAEQMIEALITASQTPNVRAHRVAEAITSYRSAFLRTHHRAAFHWALDLVTSNTDAAARAELRWPSHRR